LLFLATNPAAILVLCTLNIVFSFFGIDHSSISGLLVFAAILVLVVLYPLALSKWMAKRLPVRGGNYRPGTATGAG
jgi:heat shock protein HtpX